MQTDTLKYDTLNNRPLPKWLIDQKEGLTTIQPQKIEIREDNSLRISFIATSVFILFTVIIITVYILRKEKGERRNEST
jgi:heme/copper-type cytochrome/quinol oxidase subunit 2